MLRRMAALMPAMSASEQASRRMNIHLGGPMGLPSVSLRMSSPYRYSLPDVPCRHHQGDEHEVEGEVVSYLPF